MLNVVIRNVYRQLRATRFRWAALGTAALVGALAVAGALLAPRVERLDFARGPDVVPQWRYGLVVIQFSREMDPKRTRASIAPVGSGRSLEAADGIWSWRDTRTLVAFESDGSSMSRALAPDTAYRIQISVGSRSTFYLPLVGRKEWSFRTQPALLSSDEDALRFAREKLGDSGRLKMARLPGLLADTWLAVRTDDTGSATWVEFAADRSQVGGRTQGPRRDVPLHVRVVIDDSIAFTDRAAFIAGFRRGQAEVLAKEGPARGCLGGVVVEYDEEDSGSARDVHEVAPSHAENRAIVRIRSDSSQPSLCLALEMAVECNPWIGAVGGLDDAALGEDVGKAVFAHELLHLMGWQHYWRLTRDAPKMWDDAGAGEVAMYYLCD